MPPGTPGELCTRGYSVMLGYWDDDGADRGGDRRAGWMHTGDLATIDAEGYCNIVGRIKDMVIRGGENIYPREIEEFLFRHPKIEDVQVVGVPDRSTARSSAPGSSCSPASSANADEIQGFCRGQIAHYKMPRYVKFVDEFPMTVTGKIQKFIMRERDDQGIGPERAKDRVVCAGNLTLYRHARACRGHPRLKRQAALKTWMAGTIPAMT